MAEERPITEQDVFIKARLMSEGVRIKDVQMPSMEELTRATAALPERLDYDDVEGIWRTYAQTASLWERTSRQAAGLKFHFDGCGIKVMVMPNEYSRLQLTRQGDRVTVTDGDEILVTGYVPASLSWAEGSLSNGLPMRTFLPVVSAEIVTVAFSLSCANYVSGKDACRYCNLFANPLSKRMLKLPDHVLRSWASYQAEALKVAVDAGWRGMISLSAGALPPADRHLYLERMEIVLSEVRAALGDEAYQQQKIFFNYYPPEDFAEMHRWKALGVTGTSIDLEVMDPKYFAAICPGKNSYKPHAYWMEAQEASVEVFGPYLNTTGCLVVGIEPMEALVEGVEERISKGVMPFPLTYYSAPGSAYWGFRPPNADWFVEASRRIADSFVKSPGFLQCLAQSAGGSLVGDGAALSKHSNAMTLVFDEVLRRFQQMFAPAAPLSDVA